MAVVNQYVKGTFNLGTDKSVTITDNTTGQPIDLGGRLVSFKADPKIAEVTSEPIDNRGFNQIRQVWSGWNGTIEIDRATGAFDLLASAMENEYHNGVAQRYFTITEVVNNSENGSVTTAVYNYCIIKMQSSGTWKKDNKVEVTLDFHAQDRQVTGA